MAEGANSSNARVSSVVSLAEDGACFDPLNPELGLVEVKEEHDFYEEPAIKIEPSPVDEDGASFDPLNPELVLLEVKEERDFDEEPAIKIEPSPADEEEASNRPFHLTEDLTVLRKPPSSLAMVKVIERNVTAVQKRHRFPRKPRLDRNKKTAVLAVPDSWFNVFGKNGRRFAMSFTSEEDEILIDFVKNHECLFNVATKDFRNTQLKLSLWKEMGTTINKTGEECSKRWAYVRDYYVRRRGKPGTGSGGELAKKRSDLLSFLDSIPSSKRSTITNVEGPMDSQTYCTDADEINPIQDLENHFSSAAEEPSKGGGSLPVVLQPRKRMASLSGNPSSSGSDDTSEGGRSPLSIPQPKKQRKTSLSEERMQLLKQIAAKNSSPNEMDENDLFFSSMAKSVKRLPPPEQARIRMEVGQLVGSAEVAHFCRVSSEQPSYVNL